MFVDILLIVETGDRNRPIPPIISVGPREAGNPPRFPLMGQIDYIYNRNYSSMNKNEWDKLMKQGILVINKNPDEQGKVVKLTSFFAWLKTETAYFFRNFFRPWRIFTDVEATSEIGARIDAIDKRIDALEKKLKTLISYSDLQSDCINGIKDELDALKK
jgi:hypothetical protein